LSYNPRAPNFIKEFKMLLRLVFATPSLALNSNAVRALFLCAALAISPVPLLAQQPASFTAKPVAEKKLTKLPSGPLFWRIETFASLADAQSAAGLTGLVAEASGKVWLFTLGPRGGAIPTATKVAEIGPVPSVQAPEYLLRIMHVTGPPGARSQQHSHPGTEAFYVLKGRLGHRTAHGTDYADAGTGMNGHGADMPMEIFSDGTTDLDQLIMFVVDATRPFSSPAKFD